MLRAGEISSVALTQLCLDRVDQHDGRIQSFATVTRDLALQQATRADEELKQRKDRGPLHGIPIALKDLYATKGIATTANSRVLRDWLPEQDATVVSKLAEAGSVLLGKLRMHEFAFGVPTDDSLFPPPRNPWNTDHVTGGSSSGSGAAIAAGFCYGTLGSDTGGSIRGPSALCGIAGIKPTFGLCSRTGVVPLSWSLDHVGPMARTVEDNALILQVIAGHDPRDPFSADVQPDDYRSQLSAGVSGKRLGVPRGWISVANGVSEGVVRAFEAALEVYRGLGATVVDIDAEGFMNARNAGNLIMLSESYSYHEANLKNRPHDYGRGVFNRVREGALLTGADYVQAYRARAILNRMIVAAMSGVDAVLLPTMPAPAARLDEITPDATYRVPSLMFPANLAGLPAASTPCGFSSSGLPLGLQVIGKAFRDAEVLGIAAAYEAATDWHTRFPDV
jgi:aspartyl-tRNA(Asn)/glutamyl-tRNA(Gln) amidotransferase subunit A